MNGIGTTELIFIFIIILLIFGPEKLPEFARTLGKYYRKLNEYKRYLDEEIRKGYIEAGKTVGFDKEMSKIKSVNHDELYDELVRSARELGISPEGKSKVELAREIRLKLAEKSGVGADE